MSLQARKDDWDELTELLEALEEYVGDDRSSLYEAVQQIAEGMPARLRIEAPQFDEFKAHMAEFRIDVERVRV